MPTIIALSKLLTHRLNKENQNSIQLLMKIGDEIKVEIPEGKFRKLEKV